MHTFSLLALFGLVALVLSAPVKESGSGRRPTPSTDSSDTGADYSDPQSSSNNNGGQGVHWETGKTLTGDIEGLQRLSKFSTSTPTTTSDDNSNSDNGGPGDADWPSAEARKKSSISKSTPAWDHGNDDHQDWPSTRSPVLVPGAFGEPNFPSVNQVFFDNLAKYTGGAYVDWDEGHQTSTMASSEGGRRSGLRRTSTQTPSTGGEDTNTNEEFDRSSSPRPKSLDKDSEWDEDHQTSTMTSSEGGRRSGQRRTSTRTPSSFGNGEDTNTNEENDSSSSPRPDKESENEEPRRGSKNNRRSTPRTVVVVDQPVVVVKEPVPVARVGLSSSNGRPVLPAVDRITLPPNDY